MRGCTTPATRRPRPGSRGSRHERAINQAAARLGRWRTGSDRSRPTAHRPSRDVRRMRGGVGARLFFRRAEQLKNAISVRDDVMNGRDTGKPGVRRYERVSTRRAGGCGQNGVEGAESRSFPVKAQPFAQVRFLDDEQRRQQLDVVAGKFCGVFAITATSTDVSKFLDDLGSGCRQDRSVCYCTDQLLAWLAPWVVDANRINQDRCIKDDHACRPRSSSSSARRSPTSMGAASRIRRAAAARLRCVAGRPRSSASRITFATDVPRCRATARTRS